MHVIVVEEVEECITCGAVIYNGKVVVEGDKPCSHRRKK